MKQIVFIFLFLFSFAAAAQHPARKQFKSISRPEKCWAFTHPFVAKKAFKITGIVRADVDSIKNINIIGTDLDGGKLDAFKHAYWMASLSLSIGTKKALKLGKAHEKGNYLEYKKHKLEDSILPDSLSSAMDLANNAAGVAVFGNCRTVRDRRETQGKVLHALMEGKLFMIKKDKHGNYLTCDGQLIDMNVWKGKWGIPKCLIASDQH
ncbi:MAG: hypothetical protein JWP12_1656 [Bacteroidetes bacterium]|nr:hypothetical protein [Bacteroidota bacterium]